MIRVLKVTLGIIALWFWAGCVVRGAIIADIATAYTLRRRGLPYYPAVVPMLAGLLLAVTVYPVIWLTTYNFKKSKEAIEQAKEESVYEGPPRRRF